MPTIKPMKEEKIMAYGIHKCSICGKQFEGWGNNPRPVTNGDNDVCCDECNEEKVIPTRILHAIHSLMRKEEEDK